MDVIVIPVNDDPVLTEIGNQETSEDISLVLTLEATDVDEDDLIFSALSEHPEDVVTDVIGNQLTLSPAQDWYGTINIFVSVSDGELEDSENFELTVNSVNDTPTIDLPESFTFEEEGSLVEDFGGYTDDIDEDALTLTVSGNENLTVSIDSLLGVTFGAVQDWNGSETLIFTVEDDSSGTASDTVSVIVTPVNDAPLLVVPDAQDTDEDTPLVITLEATDVDEDDLIFSAFSEHPEDVIAEVTGDQLTLSPVQNWNGTVNIFVSVSDGELDDSENFVLTVTPVNDTPVIDSTSVLTALEETPLEITLGNLFVTDVDNVYPDDFTLTVLEGENYTAAGTTITPVLDFFGELTVPV